MGFYSSNRFDNLDADKVEKKFNESTAVAPDVTDGPVNEAAPDVTDGPTNESAAPDVTDGPVNESAPDVTDGPVNEAAEIDALLEMLN